MSITDPTIDPVTGLPVLNPQDVIQQIPLGVQTFPYEDLQATARPTRGPLYGDDILPTSALLAGQNPITGSAQTVETDGSHAAKVYVVNGGSSGINWDYTTGRQEDGFFPDNRVQWDTISPSPTRLYAFTGQALANAIVTTGGGVFGRYIIGFGEYTGSLDFPLFSGIFSFDPTYPNYIYANLTWDLLWPNGLPIPADIIAANNFTVWTDGGGFRGEMTYTLLYA